MATDPDKREARRKGYYLTEHLLFHIGIDGDRIVQPPFAVHAVFTRPSYVCGRVRWSIVSGYEGLDVYLAGRGTKLLNNFVLDVDRTRLIIDIRTLGHAYVTRLLKVRDYRIAALKFEREGGKSLLDHYKASNATVHLKMMFRANYNLDDCLARVSKRGPGASSSSRFKSKTKIDQGLGLTDMTAAEQREWRRVEGVLDDVNETASSRL